ncbi:hypothetical protein NE237_023044 [Protea cynaroides]|uniref:Uncharacterized protein n=1 Tax=Protea cynaroides TaxID=273540 RepID=A0A9Q0HC75_9MAGN|nr:hypothetical protein NE237_023044 [Protea cynaroides]
MIENDMGILYHQSVTYDWRAPHCLSCGVFGHIHDSCKKTLGDADTPEAFRHNLHGCSEPPPSAVPASCPEVIVSQRDDVSENIHGDGGEVSGFQKDNEWVPVRVKKKRSGLRECLNLDRPLTRLPPPGRQSASSPIQVQTPFSNPPLTIPFPKEIPYSKTPPCSPKATYTPNPFRKLSKPVSLASPAPTASYTSSEHPSLSFAQKASAPAPPDSYTSPDALPSSVGHTPHPKKHQSIRSASPPSSESPADTNQLLEIPALNLPPNHNSTSSLPGLEPSLRPGPPSSPPRGSTLIPAPMPFLFANSAPGVPPHSSIDDYFCSHGKPSTPLTLNRNLNRKVSMLEDCHCNLDSSQSDEEDAVQLKTQSERNLKSIWDEKMGDDLDLPHNLPY